MTIAPDIPAESASDLALAHIRGIILSGAVRPNHRLVEEELAGQLGVSRTPVREALLRLRQEGLVVQRKGWFVKDHDPTEVLEFLEARAGLESAAARLAARRIDAPRLELLESLIVQMEAAGENRKAFDELNGRFHAAITEAGANPVLTSLTRGTTIHYWNFPVPILFTREEDTAINEEHRQLLTALRRRDGEAAARLAWVHVERTVRIIARSMNLRYWDHL